MNVEQLTGKASVSRSISRLDLALLAAHLESGNASKKDQEWANVLDRLISGGVVKVASAASNEIGRGN